MNRKLLPYEHQLIEALGVTKEEYLNFVDIQREYQDPKVGTQLDVRNEAGTVAIVLTVVGILFQVAAALLTPKPSIPSMDDRGNRRNRREERFAPTYGFNSAQELASYNDPVNLVYTNKAQNPNGGVRLAGSLVWSEIESYGSAQFMTMMLVLGASKITNIEAELTAFGQIAVKDLDPSLMWLFFDDNGSGKVQFKDIVFGNLQGSAGSNLNKKLALLPPSYISGVGNETDVCRIRSRKYTNREVGFSQAYTPTTAIAFGAYDPIPIFVKIFSRDEDGDLKDAPIGVKLGGVSDNGKWPGSGSFFNVGQEITLFFAEDDNDAGDDLVAQNAAALRQQYVDSIDFGATYMLGNAKFRLKEIVGSTRNIDNRVSRFKFECIERGSKPTTDYKNDEVIEKTDTSVDVSDYIKYRKLLDRNSKENDNIVITGFGMDYDFSGRETVEWTDKNGKAHEERLFRNGSIEFSKEKRRQQINNPPKLDTSATRKTLRTNLRNLQDLLEDIEGGEYDDKNPLKKAIKDAKTNDKTLTKLKDDKNQKRDKQEAIRQSNKTNDEKREKINDLQKLINSLQEDIANRELQLTAKERKPYIRDIKNKNSSFKAIDGVRYPYGIRYAENQLDDVEVASGISVDQKGANAIKQFYDSLIDEKEQARDDLSELIGNWNRRILEADVARLNKSFFTKCIAKVESASYETISEVDLVKFSLKSTIYRRISGRQKFYGRSEDPVRDYDVTDNGLKSRTAYFRVSYKKITDANYNVFPLVFAIRHGTESAFYGQLNFEPTGTPNKRHRYQFKFEPVFDLVAEIRLNGQRGVGFIESEGQAQSEADAGVTWFWHGDTKKGIAFDGFPEAYQETEQPKLTYEHDMFQNSSDTSVQFSFNNGPEFVLAGVTEQQFLNNTDPAEVQGSKYRSLTTMAMIVRAGAGIEDLRNVTAFVKKGKHSYRVPVTEDRDYTIGTSSTSYAPDIFVDTAIDPVNGVGKYIPSPDAVLDKGALIRAMRFCQNNNLPVENGQNIELFFDGVIADLTSWREFWISNAPFSLLEFVRKNGKEALVPALPTDDAGKAAGSGGKPVVVPISALFTSGNILEGSYKEEFLDYGPGTQDIVATVIYRETSEDSVFDRKSTVEVHMADLAINAVTGKVDKAVYETFDASTFVTQKEQAIMIGKLLVNQRRYIRRGVEFKTFPSKDPLEPGSFIYVDVGNTSWDDYSSGVVMSGGELNIPLYDTVRNGTYDFLLFDHKSGDTKKLNNKTVTNKTATSLSAYEGWMFVMGKENPSKRVFRITEVALDEEGEVSVKAMEYPCDDEQRARVADFRSSNFKVR